MALVGRAEDLAAAVRGGDIHEAAIAGGQAGGVVEGPAGSHQPFRIPARARIRPRHVQAEVPARHREVARLLHHVPVQEVHALHERVADGQDGPVRIALTIRRGRRPAQGVTLIDGGHHEGAAFSVST